MTKYDTIKTAIKGTLAAAIFATGIGLGACNNENSEFSEATKNMNPTNTKYSELYNKITEVQERAKNLEGELQNNGNTIVNVYCNGSSSCPNNLQESGDYVTGGCGNNECSNYVLSKIKECSVPNEYKNAEPLCDNPSSHTSCKSDSDHELIIGYNNGKIFLNRKNPSFVSANSVRINYKDGSGPQQGKNLENVVFLIQNADNCRSVVISDNENIPADYKNIMVTAFGYDVSGSVYKIASAQLCSSGNNQNNNQYGGFNGNPNWNNGRAVYGNSCVNNCVNNCNCGNNGTGNETHTGPSTTGTSEVPITEAPTGDGQNGLESKVLDTPRLHDNDYNYFAIDWKPLLGSNKYPDNISIGICKDGADDNGNIKFPCTDDKIVYKVGFELRSVDKQGIAHYAGFVPKVKKSFWGKFKYATYRVTGIELDGTVYGVRSNTQSINSRP